MEMWVSLDESENTFGSPLHRNGLSIKQMRTLKEIVQIEKSREIFCQSFNSVPTFKSKPLNIHHKINHVFFSFQKKDKIETVILFNKSCSATFHIKTANQYFCFSFLISSLEVNNYPVCFPLEWKKSNTILFSFFPSIKQHKANFFLSLN